MQYDLFLKAFRGLSQEQELKMWDMIAMHPPAFFTMQRYFEKKYEAVRSNNTKALTAIIAEEERHITETLGRLEHE